MPNQIEFLDPPTLPKPQVSGPRHPPSQPRGDEIPPPTPEVPNRRGLRQGGLHGDLGTWPIKCHQGPDPSGDKVAVRTQDTKKWRPQKSDSFRFKPVFFPYVQRFDPNLS